MGTPRTAVWLLDVDGVLNAVTWEPDADVWPEWQHGSATAEGRTWPITFAPSLMRCINDLNAAGLVDIRWLTTWRTAANDSLRELLGLPELPVEGAHHAADPSTAAFDGSVVSHGAWTGGAGSDAGEWWKLSAVRRIVAAEGRERPVIWTDDDLAYRYDAVEWVRAHVDRSLLIAPEPTTGLTPADLDRIRAFVAADG